MSVEDLVSRKAVLDLAKDICVPAPSGECRHKSIDPMEIYKLPSAELPYYKNNNDLLIEGILRGLNRSGIYGEDATYELCNILKDMGRYDLLPPCFNDRA